MGAIHIGFVEVPLSIEQKLRQIRGFTGQFVREAVEWPARPDRVAWHDDPVHGRRLIAFASVPQGILKVILQPVDAVQGTWRLRTAVVTKR